MRALAPYLVVLLWAAHHTTADSLTWYKTRVSNGKLEGNITRTRRVDRDLQCAVLSSQDPEAHLFCTPTPDNCTSYGIKVGSGYKDPNNGPVTDCWTRHPSDCDVEGERHLGYNCSLSVCQQGLLQPSEGLVFYYPLTEKCVSLDTTDMTRDDARTSCDLFVPITMQGLEEYMKDVSAYCYAWLGIKNRTWLDGRPVAADDWSLGQPNGDPQECGFGYPYNGTQMRVVDSPCSNYLPSLCEIVVPTPP